MVIFTTIIAITSLAISFTSLYYSLKKNKNDTRLITAQKKTELLIKLIDSKIKLEKQHSNFNNIKKIWKDCDSCPKDQLEQFERDTNKILDDFNYIYKKLTNVTEDTDPLLLEKLIPFYYELSQHAEDSFKLSRDLIQGCHSCQVNNESDEILKTDASKDGSPQLT